MKHYVIIVAGGKGKRMGGKLPKQFMEINDAPIIFHTINRFLAVDKNTSFVVVLPKDYLDYWQDLLEKHGFTFNHKVVIGGKERFHSVQNGLQLVPDDAVVGVHDAARPLVSPETIERCVQTCVKHNTAVPVMPLKNSIRNIKLHKNAVRNDFVEVQTPQYFNAGLLKKAYSVPFSPEFTDDASVYETSIEPVHLTQGNEENIKITSPVDLALAKLLMD